MNGLDLFSGIGGLSLALQPWVKTIAYCENDRFCQAVLLSRMQDGSLPYAPVWDDVRTLDAEELATASDSIEIIFGGFPCQDISVAGSGRGMEAGARSGLFSEIVRLTQEIRPAFVFLENVPAIRTRGLARVLSEFTALGYDCRWTVVSAAELGAPHLRKRWFMLAADSSSEFVWKQQRWRSGKGGERATRARDNGSKKSLAHSNGEGLEVGKHGHAGQFSPIVGACGWAVEPDVGRVAHGIPFRVDRLRGLGNAVVPQQAREAFKRLTGLK